MMWSMTDEQLNEAKAAKATLINLGYTYHGGEMWKPPLGEPPAYITWDGEGVPPAGAECEALPTLPIDSGEWKLIQVLFSNSEYVFAISHSDYGSRPRIYEVSEWVFRKHETPEEREARKKAKACGAIAAILTFESALSDDAERIYDAIAAGKIPGIPPLNND